MECFDDCKMAEIFANYPAEKPVCFNYMRARADVLALCGAVKELQHKIDRMESLHQKGVQK